MRAALAVGVCVLVGACSPDPANPVDAGHPFDAGLAFVSLSGARYSPADANVNAGMTVTWRNDDAVLHTVTSGPPGRPDGLFDVQLPPGTSFSYAFPAPGSFPYYCRFHYGMGMVGSVSVEPGVQPSP